MLKSNFNAFSAFKKFQSFLNVLYLQTFIFEGKSAAKFLNLSNNNIHHMNSLRRRQTVKNK